MASILSPSNGSRPHNQRHTLRSPNNNDGTAPLDEKSRRLIRSTSVPGRRTFNPTGTAAVVVGSAGESNGPATGPEMLPQVRVRPGSAGQLRLQAASSNALGAVEMAHGFDDSHHVRGSVAVRRPVSAGSAAISGTGGAATHRQEQLRADASQNVLHSKKNSGQAGSKHVLSASGLYFPIVNGGLGATDSATTDETKATAMTKKKQKQKKKHRKRSKSKNQATTPRGGGGSGGGGGEGREKSSHDSKNKPNWQTGAPTRGPSTVSRPTATVEHEDHGDRQQQNVKSRAGAKAIPGVPDEATLEARRRARSEIKERERQKSERRRVAAEKRVAERRDRRSKRLEKERRRAQAKALARKELEERRIQEKRAAAAAVEEARETKSGLHFIHFIDRQSRKAAAAAEQKIERERRSAAALSIQCAVRVARAQRAADDKRQAILARERQHQAEIERRTAKAEAMRQAELRRERGKEVKLVRVCNKNEKEKKKWRPRVSVSSFGSCAVCSCAAGGAKDVPEKKSVVGMFLLLLSSSPF